MNSQNLEEDKLLQLLEAVDSVLAHEDAEDLLGVDTLGQFLEIQQLLRGWLANDATLTHEQRLGILTNFTEILANVNSATEGHKARLH